METATNDSYMPKYENISETNQMSEPAVSVLIGHSIEAITSAVVLASLGQRVHLYADIDLLTEQIQPI